MKPSVVFFHERAPFYADMNREFAAMRPGDATLVIGTSLSVVPVHKFLLGKKDVTGILNVLNLEDILADVWEVGRAFKHVLACPATEAVERVAELLPWLDET